MATSRKEEQMRQHGTGIGMRTGMARERVATAAESGTFNLQEAVFWGGQLGLLTLMGYVWVIFGMSPYSVILSLPLLALGGLQARHAPYAAQPIQRQAPHAVQRKAMRVTPITVTPEVALAAQPLAKPVVRRSRTLPTAEGALERPGTVPGRLHRRRVH